MTTALCQYFHRQVTFIEVQFRIDYRSEHFIDNLGIDFSKDYT
jgi:hypothetical protein